MQYLLWRGVTVGMYWIVTATLIPNAVRVRADPVAAANVGVAVFHVDSQVSLTAAALVLVGLLACLADGRCRS